MKPWKTVSRQTILAHSQFLTVEEHTVELPDGQQITNWPWVKLRNYVIVLPRTTEGKYVCFRQTKYAVEGITLATVAGLLEANELPFEAAQRELLEETGYKASKWVDLGSYPVGGNNLAATAHLFFADDAEQIQAPDADDLEEQELLLLSRDELQAALEAGEFKVLAWTTVVALVLLRT